MVNFIPVHSYTILTIGGKTLWTEGYTEDSVEQILIHNELYTDSIQKYGDVYLCRINTEKTQMSDFYMWNEITNPTTFCWRTLYTFGEKQNWLPHPNESIGIMSYQAICTMISKDITV
jgi:hypothetical protein